MFWGLLLAPNYLVGKFLHRPWTPARDYGTHVSGLVIFPGERYNSLIWQYLSGPHKCCLSPSDIPSGCRVPVWTIFSKNPPEDRYRLVLTHACFTGFELLKPFYFHRVVKGVWVTTCMSVMLIVIDNGSFVLHPIFFSLHLTIISPLLIDPATNKCVGVWSATYRAPYCFGLGFLVLDEAGENPVFKDVIKDEKDIDIIFGTWFRSVKLTTKLSVNDHSYFDEVNCRCHRRSERPVELV